jgi:hypothetical protein
MTEVVVEPVSEKKEALGENKNILNTSQMNRSVLIVPKTADRENYQP